MAQPGSDTGPDVSGMSEVAGAAAGVHGAVGVPSGSASRQSSGPGDRADRAPRYSLDGCKAFAGERFDHTLAVAGDGSWTTATARAA